MRFQATAGWKGAIAASAVLVALLATGLPALAQTGQTRLEGTIFDTDGNPVPECRVVARVADGTEVYISPPSDGSGWYSFSVPSGGRYVLVALVAPTGGRVELPESTPLTAVPGSVERDITIPMPVAPQPRKGPKGQNGIERMFFSFVEDPAVVSGPYVELQVDATRSDLIDSTSGTLVVASSFSGLPRVEVGLRGGFAEIDPSGSSSESGAADTEVWAKLHVFRSSGNRWDLALGALMTLPTGDQDAGLSPDALQSKLFLAGSYAIRSAAIVFHVGARTTEDGEFVAPNGTTFTRDGQVSASAGFGAFVPFSDRMSLVFEVKHDGERFEDTESDTRALAGMNWRTHERGILRLAVAAGLEDDVPPDSEFILGYALTF